MNVHWRIDSSNARHTRVTLFLGGANCGQLTIETSGANSIDHFLVTFRHGLVRSDAYRESGCFFDPEKGALKSRRIDEQS